jgi:hypothetical protein
MQFTAVSLQTVTMVSCHTVDMLLHKRKLSNAICGVLSWYICYYMFYCTQNFQLSSWSKCHMTVLSLSETDHCNEGPYLVSMVMFQSLLISSSEHHPLCWQCDSKHRRVWQQVLTARDVVTYHTMRDTETVFQNVSAVNSIYCSARKKSKCGENTLVTVTHNEQDTQLNLFLSTFWWVWRSLTLSFISLSLQFTFIWMGLCHQWRTASSSISQNFQCNLAVSIHCHVYLCQGGARSGVVSWGTVLQAGRLQVQFPTVSLDFFIDMILPAALWPWGRLGL